MIDSEDMISYSVKKAGDFDARNNRNKFEFSKSLIINLISKKNDNVMTRWR